MSFTTQRQVFASLLASTLAASGCAEPEPADEPEATTAVERVVVHFDGAGQPVVSRERVARDVVRAEEAARERGGSASAKVSLDSGCGGASFWAYSGAGRTGTQLCVFGRGTLSLADLGWYGGFGSYWAGNEAGLLADATAGAAFGCEEPFGPYALANTGACGRGADTLVFGAEPTAHLRIGTFNAAFVTDTWVDAAFVPACTDHVCRANLLADRIILSNYDVIALNEVFDNDAREVLVTRLRGAYPHFVAKLSTDTFDDDSGLMLFSRLPFIAPSRVDTSRFPTGSDLEAESAGAPWPQVGFVEFDRCDDFDCRAAKGAGYVRLLQPATGRTFGVLFSHTQASYGSDSAAEREEKRQIRRSQLEQARDLLAALSAGGLDDLGDQVFFLGDLNINGDQDAGVPEWWDTFGFGSWTPLTSGTPLFDAWAYLQSPDDRGLSQDSERLDYVLTQTPDTLQGALCVQHLSLAQNLAVNGPIFDHAFGPGLGGSQNLSDHQGVNAELGPAGPQCNPRTAATPPLDTWLAGSIALPGSVQWWYLPEPGTYTLSVLGDAVSSEVYAASDLSRPRGAEPAVDGVPHNGTTIASREPMYVKVYARNPRWSGGYQLRVHRHACTHPGDYCRLFAGKTQSLTMTAPWYQDDAAWYLVTTEVADSGRPQALAFGVDASVPLTLELRDAATMAPVLGSSAPHYDWTGWHTRARSSDGTLDGGSYWLLARRTSTAPVSLEAWFDTNLTHFHGPARGGTPLTLACDDETELGEDEIAVQVVVDGVWRGQYPLGEFDEGSWMSLPPELQDLRYVDRLELRLVEHDPGVDDWSDWVRIGNLAAESPAAAYDTGTAPGVRHFTIDDTGEYTLRYNLGW